MTIDANNLGSYFSGDIDNQEAHLLAAQTGAGKVAAVEASTDEPVHVIDISDLDADFLGYFAATFGKHPSAPKAPRQPADHLRRGCGLSQRQR